MDTLRDGAISIVRTLADAGHVTYLAGGCVRDRLLGTEPKDYDVATDAPPDVVKTLIRGARLVGESFGVVMVPIKVRGERRYIEVATFRREWGYADGRRPDHVEFTDAQHDALRRDFTINGLFEDPLAGDAVIDFVGGVADLSAGVIRAIGDPSERFGEDYLRMLRAVRFAARLSFEIDDATARAIRNNARYLSQISRERIGQEVQWMLTGQHPQRAAALMQSLYLDAPTLNEDRANVSLPTMNALMSGGNYRLYTTQLAAWLMDRHPRLDATQLPDMARRWRRALCLSNDEYDSLKATLDICAQMSEWATLPVAQRKRLLARSHAVEGLALFVARRADEDTSALQAQVAALFDAGVAPAPWVGGDDLIAIGCTPGPQFKPWLDQVYDAQLEGRITTRDEALAMLQRLGAHRA